jgi:Ala-tRNA(Pro) deacylase
MAIPSTIHAFLGAARVPYCVLPHREALSAQEEAAVMHVSGRSWAKVEVCIADGKAIHAVLPAPFVVNLEELLALTGAHRIRFAVEEELSSLFLDCDIGAMPPLGPMYGHRVFVDEGLSERPEIVFNAGTHRDAIRMRFADFATAVRPVVGRFAEPRAEEVPPVTTRMGHP